jgi:hypothetical protein
LCCSKILATNAQEESKLEESSKNEKDQITLRTKKEEALTILIVAIKDSLLLTIGKIIELLELWKCGKTCLKITMLPRLCC